MKSVLISIQPKWVEKIASGKKTVEVRKTVPKLEPPFKCYIYCTNKKPFLVWGDVFDGGSFNNEFTHISGYNRKAAEKIWDLFNGKVMGEFVCDRIECFTTDYRRNEEQTQRISRQSCVDMVSLMEYEANAACLYGWHISNLTIYDEPKDLDWFRKPATCWPQPGTVKCYACHDCEIKRPPQSWCYVEGIIDG